jgi:tRNA G10  N-methylase Trm11
MRGGTSPDTSPDSELHYTELENLGFNEEDLDYFFTLIDESYDNIKRQYLEIARRPPYNRPWQTIDDAVRSPDQLNVSDETGQQLTKADIASDTINYFYFPHRDDMYGGKRRRNRNKSRKSKRKPKRKPKRKSTRKMRRYRK